MSKLMKGYKWPGKYKPFKHQVTTSEFLVANKKAFCLSEMGTGKTMSVVWASDFLISMGLVKRVLIICPLSIMKSAWQADLFKTAIHRSVAICYGTTKQRQSILNQRTEYVIINPDGVGTVEKELIACKFDLVVVDEADCYKTHTTQKWKTLNRVIKNVKGLWLLTGTPAAQAPTDAYGLAKLVNPDGVPKFLGAFRDMVMTKYGPFKWVPKPNASEIVHKVLQPAIRFEKRDCLDLPPITYTDREVEMTEQQKRYYKEMKRQLLFNVKDGVVSSANAAVLQAKLVQIASGCVYTDDGGVLEFDVSNRLTELREVIDSTEQKVLVFVPYKHTIDLVRRYLDGHKIQNDVISGNVNINKRNDIIDRFQEDWITRVLILQPQTASHGLTLTKANVIVWYAPPPSVRIYMQANGRIDRPGQKHNMSVVHLIGSKAEEKLYRSLSGRLDDFEGLLDWYRQEMGDEKNG